MELVYQIPDQLFNQQRAIFADAWQRDDHVEMLRWTIWAFHTYDFCVEVGVHNIPAR